VAASLAEPAQSAPNPGDIAVGPRLPVRAAMA
jgi:hypothetical protein